MRHTGNNHALQPALQRLLPHTRDEGGVSTHVDLNCDVIRRGGVCEVSWGGGPGGRWALAGECVADLRGEGEKRRRGGRGGVGGGHSW